MEVGLNRSGDDEIPGNAQPFPSVSTFLGIAVAFIALWLLASGAREWLAAPDNSAPATVADRLGSK